MGYLDVFTAQAELIAALGRDKAYIVWVMAYYLEEQDITALAASSLTDGPDDKKIDFIFLDRDEKRLVFVQGYYSTALREAAPANKAADLNIAAAWLFSGDIATVPETIRDIIVDCRNALVNNEIDDIELLYVHNLPESVNVARELETATEHLRRYLEGSIASVRGIELGNSRIQYLHDARESHIEVRTQQAFPSKFAFTESGPDWTAYVASVPGAWLHNIYSQHGESLFSANYRGFLGASRRRRVNLGIRDSAESRGADFWAFNNGITILTLGVDNENSDQPLLSGISIINGAQTTGSIGDVDISKRSVADIRVLCRVIESHNPGKIAEIVRFNNTQNAITSWDQYSNDPEQKRLVSEFEELGFSYNIKRGYIGGSADLGMEEVIQPLLAFNQRPSDANRGKNMIFDRKPLYQAAFEGKKARHILFVHSLSRAIDEKRLALKDKSNKGELIQIETEHLAIMRNLRFKPFFIALTSTVIETLLGKRCDRQNVAFKMEVCRDQSLDELSQHWAPVVSSLLALVTAVPEAREFGGRLSDDTYIPSLSRSMNALIYAMQSSEKHKAFADIVTGT